MKLTNSVTIRVLLLLLGGFWSATVAAQNHSPEHNQENASGIAHRHHLSVFLGNTHLFEPNHPDEDGFTLGIDYEYRFSHRIGAGFVAEYATGSLDATTLMSAIDVHLYKGLVMQLGAGVEFIDGHTNKLGRLGSLYEFEFEKFTLSPQIHYDFTADEDSLVIGIAIGKNF